MAILKVAQLGHPVLRKKAEPVAPEQIASAELQAFIADMIETNDEYNGAGLAAPQVHRSLQIIVVGSSRRAVDGGDEEDSIPLITLINPKLSDFSAEMEEDWEGCLSVGDLWGRVRRARAAAVTGLDRDGEPVTIKAEGFLARVFQHEIDHLHGKVFLDRMSDFSSLSFRREFQRFHELYE